MRALAGLRGSSLGRYVAVGAVNTAVSTLVFLALHAAGVALTVAGAIGFLAGAVISFTLNRGWTFADAGRAARSSAWRFGVVTLVGVGLSALLVRVAVRDVGLSALPGQLVAVACVTCVTYVLSRRWAFAPGTADDAALSLSSSGR